MRVLFCKISDLKNICQTEKNIYCFGSGRYFDTFFHHKKCRCLIHNVKAVVDNDRDKTGTVKKIGEYVFPIVDIGYLLEHIQKSDCIMVTSVHYQEMIEQMNAYKELDATDCYLAVSLLNREEDDERLKMRIPKRSVSREIKIPKIIHYCWFGKKEIPMQYKNWMESWKKYCADYEIIEWNEDNYDVYKNQYISQAYDLKQWAFVSDYARVDIINEYGGVYLDTDVELIKNIDVLLQNDAFCGFETNQHVNFGLGFGAAKYNRIVSDVKEYYDGQKFILEDGSLNKTTCPMIQTQVMKKYGLECNGMFQLVGGMTVYPSRVLCGMSPYTFRLERNPVYTYAIHHFAASWHTDNNWKNNKVNLREWPEDDNYIYPDL